MPSCGAAFDEIPSPLGQGGTSGGFWEGNTNPPRRSATAVAAHHLSDGGDFQTGLSETRNWDTVL
jgi:hypothetical protein